MAGMSKKHILVRQVTAPCGAQEQALQFLDSDDDEHMKGPMLKGKGCAAPTTVYTTRLTYPLHHGGSAGGVSARSNLRWSIETLHRLEF